jgi:hypothetical protein
MINADNMRFGFVYLWHDTKRKKFYLGSHLGLSNDGYTGSNKRFKCAYKSRPETFKRKILEYGYFDSHKLLHVRENYWLSFIKDEELCEKYYNEKKLASGGDIVSKLSTEKRKLHKDRSILARQRGLTKWLSSKSSNELTVKAKYARNSWTQSSYENAGLKKRKLATITTPSNDIIEVSNLKKFCDDNNLNYGNMKSVLRGERDHHKNYMGFWKTK